AANARIGQGPIVRSILSGRRWACPGTFIGLRGWTEGRKTARCYNHQCLRPRLSRRDAPFQPDVGEWLSLVEHLVRDQGVGGSNPLSPTNLSKFHSSP